jgi:hypothetical protein
VLQIDEVIGPAEQGRSIPYLCRAEDGELYYVKGQQTNRSSLWAEWICGHAARAMGLTIPPFCLVQIDEALLAELPREDRKLGSLPAFASQKHRHVVWLEPAMVGQVPAEVQRDVLVFDWWVQNTDRLVKNSNLLWDADTESLVVIDHNLALLPGFNPAEFLQHHIFASQWDAVVGDLVVRDRYMERLAVALVAAEEARRTAPEAWLWENSEFDMPCPFDVDQAMQTLSRCATLDLWRTE